MKIRLFRTSDDYHHHYRHWTPAGDSIRGYVVSLHGIQSHSGWYEYSSQRLAEAGYDVRFLDRRGSGLNGCQRGHTPHYERLIHDVRQFLTKLNVERASVRPGVPIILTGLSWGGKIATVCAARYPHLIDGLGLLYPGICARVTPTRWQRGLLRLGVNSGQGKKRIPIPLDDPALFTGEKEWQEFIRRDPLSLHQVSLDFLHASVELERIIQNEAASVKVPLLMLLAGQDQIINNRGTLQLVEELGASQSRVILYREARHTLEFEKNRHEIFSDVIHWMNQLSRPTSTC